MIGQQQAPAELLEAVRQVDPRADLVHLAGRRWLLGVRKPNPAAREKLEGQMRQLTTSSMQIADRAERATLDFQVAQEIEVLQLCAEGFHPIQMYTVRSDWTIEGHDDGWTIPKDFALRDHNWRTRREEAFREMKDAASLDRGNERRSQPLRDFLAAEGRFLWRHVFARARRFVNQFTPQRG